MRKAAWTAGVVLVALLAAAAGLFWRGVAYQSYTQRELAAGLALDTAGMGLPELYAALLPLCDDFLQDHTLTQIEGDFAMDGGVPTYGEVRFSFYKYVDDKAEGGRVSVVLVTVNDEVSGAVTVWEFYGAGKANSTPGQALLTVPETLLLAENALVRQAAEQPRAGRFRVWRTVVALIETGGAGEPAVEVYGDSG